jgi:serine/threonine protein kinase
VANPKSKNGDDGGPGARVGTVIKGKWTIDALLGVGGMAAVYAASHRNGQRAALKILHTDFAREKAICERFLREAYVSNKVNHGATVQVLDDDVTDAGEPFLIMELLEGETVRDAWKKSGRTMPVGRVLQICERVLDCLASCHAIKVIHRDLKPANIFILNEDEVRVLDFGVAQMRDATSERTATGTALGTPAYMSPEQAMGLVDQLDGRADLFSVGAMMHALITGHRINNGRTEQEALVMAATKPVPSVARLAPKLPVELIKVIDKSLAWDRRNRYQDARDMQNALLELMLAQGVQPLLGRPPPRPAEVVAPPPPDLLAQLQAQVGAAMPAPPPPVGPSGPAAAPVPPLAAPPVPAPLKSSHPTGSSMGSAISPHRAPMRSQPPFDPLLGGLPPAAPFAARSPERPPEPASPAPVETPESDPRVQATRDLMKHFDRVFPGVRQFGWAHPATERSLRILFDAFSEALAREPSLVDWTLRPYSFMTLGHTVWEPGAPFDAIPYNLFACGVRQLKIAAGVTFEEMKELLALFLLDPGCDLPPEDDLAAALWEKALPHVTWQCVDTFAEGDAAEREGFYDEAEQLESLAESAAKQNQINRLEVQAMALSTDDGALAQKKERSPFALDDGTRQQLLGYFDLSNEIWSERFVDALVEGYLDSAANRDAPLILASLRRSATDLVVAGRLAVAVQINLSVIDRLNQRVQGPSQAKLVSALTNAMFGGETLEILLRRLREDPSGLDAFAVVLPALTGAELPAMLAAFREVTHPGLRSLLAAFIEQHAAGREGELGQAAPGSDPESGGYLLQLLGRMGTPAARQMLAQLAQQTEDVNLRVEARVIVAPSPEHAQQELSALLENASALYRLAALRTITRYGIRNAWPTVARIIGGKGFNELGADERREFFRTCMLVSPDRGEPILLEIVKKGGVLTSEERETTRAAAAELLGELSRSRPTAAALQEIASARWGVSEETRLVASNAAKRIGQRLAQAQGSMTA